MASHGHSSQTGMMFCELNDMLATVTSHNHLRPYQNDVARMVQFVGETNLDASPIDHRDDLADSLSDHLGQLRFCLRAGDPAKSSVDRGTSICHQPRSEPDLYADSIWTAKPSTCSRGHLHRLDNDHLVHDRNLAAQ